MPSPIKYPQLQNIPWVYQQLKRKELGGEGKSMKGLSQELNCPASCIRWVVTRKLSDSQKADLTYERKPHKNNMSKVKLD